MHWVARGTGTFKDKDELVGWAHFLGVSILFFVFLIPSVLGQW
jgi:hypothetical protein